MLICYTSNRFSTVMLLMRLSLFISYSEDVGFFGSLVFENSLFLLLCSIASSVRAFQFLGTVQFTST
jgi:hypothetical protein